jgi:hypothetical protein
MNSESRFIVEIWELVRDQLPTSKRQDIASGLIRSAVDYGFDPRDLNDLLDEDPTLARAVRALDDAGDEEPETYDDSDDE